MSPLIKLCQTNSKTPNLLHVSYITRSVLRALSKHGSFLRKKSTSVWWNCSKRFGKALKKLRNKICISVSKVRRTYFLVLLKHFKNKIFTEQLWVAHPAKSIRDFWQVSQYLESWRRVELDEALVAKVTDPLRTAYYLWIKLHLRSLAGFWIRPW